MNCTSYFRFAIAAALAGLCCLICFPGTILAQDGGGNNGGGDTGGITTPITQVPQTAPTNTGTGLQGFSPDAFNSGDILNGFDIDPGRLVIENERVQPYVGASSGRMELQGIPTHPLTRATSEAGGLRLNAGGGGRGGGRGGGQGAERSFSVPRAGLRTQTVSRFQVVRPTNIQRSNRFQNRVSRISRVEGGAGAVQVTIENRIATLRGTASSSQERDRIERSARLEPGIDRIVNEIQVNQ